MKLLDKHINDVTEAEWRTLYDERGLTLTDLASAFGVSLKTVSIRMDKCGVKRRGYGPRKTVDIPEAELLELYVNQKLTVVKVAKHFGCSDGVIRKKLKKLGMLRVSRPSKGLTRAFLLAGLEKQTTKELAKSLGVSVTTLYRAIHRAGIPVGESHRTRLNANVIESVATLYQSGKTVANIVETTNLARGEVVSALAKAQVEMRSCTDYQRKLPPDNEVAEMYLSGNSVGEVAELCGATKHAVLTSLRKSGTTLRSKSEAVTGKGNSMYGKKHTLETRSKMSSAYIEKVRELPPADLGSWGNPTLLDTPHQGTVMTRSGWEAAVGRYFNYHKIDYLYEPDTFSGCILDRLISYTPDFRLSDGKYIEVKGFFTDEAREKVAYFQDSYDIVVWEKEELQELGILDSSFRPII